MSQQAVAEILTRALRDRDFATALKTEPDTALAGYDLTPEERLAIEHGSRDEGSAGAAPLEDRPRQATRLV